MLQRIELKLPWLHADQARAYRALKLHRYRAVRCGRRWGKTLLIAVIAADAAAKGFPAAICAPDYKRTSETFLEVRKLLEPVRDSSSKVEGTIRTITGGQVDFWTLNDENACRGRFYKVIGIDEGAFTDDETMMDIWERSIEPTLLDLDGVCWVLSNTNGMKPKNFMYRICTEPKFGFKEYHAPSHSNPTVPRRKPNESTADWLLRRKATFDRIKASRPPLVYQQEYLAEFVDWSGVAFFELQKMLVDGKPVPFPVRCDAVMAVIDTATKTGQEHDGTAVTFSAVTRHGGLPHPLVILDWDIKQIEGADLEIWLPGIFARLEDLARETQARAGSLGVWIEDKVSGTVLLQQAAKRGWQAQAIESKLTSMGKSERAIAASPHVYQGSVKISEHAYNKVVVYKGHSRNHLIDQVTGFRVGDTDTEEDDLTDCFSYQTIIALGNAEGF